jgi:hypothetical protein
VFLDVDITRVGILPSIPSFFLNNIQAGSGMIPEMVQLQGGYPWRRQNRKKSYKPQKIVNYLNSMQNLKFQKMLTDVKN